MALYGLIHLIHPLLHSLFPLGATHACEPLGNKAELKAPGSCGFSQDLTPVLQPSQLNLRTSVSPQFVLKIR